MNIVDEYYRKHGTLPAIEFKDDELDMNTLFKVPPERALKYLAKKDVVTTKSWDALRQAAKKDGWLIRPAETSLGNPEHYCPDCQDDI